MFGVASVRFWGLGVEGLGLEERFMLWARRIAQSRYCHSLLGLDPRRVRL